MQCCNGICGSILLPEVLGVDYRSRWVRNSVDFQDAVVSFATEVIRVKHMRESKIRPDSKLLFFIS